MKNKNKLKLVLDAVMTLLLLVLFKKNSISLEFHEVAGILAIVVMLVHFAVNFLWVKGISSKFFAKNLPARTRISYIINMLMFLDVILLAISSVLISKKIFKINAGPTWIRLHFFAAWFLISLAGLHLGLHFNYIKNTLSAKKSKVGKIIFIAVFSVIAIFGVHSIATSSYLMQISSPFAALIQKDDDHEDEAAIENATGSTGSTGSPTPKPKAQEKEKVRDWEKAWEKIPTEAKECNLNSPQNPS